MLLYYKTCSKFIFLVTIKCGFQLLVMCVWSWEKNSLYIMIFIKILCASPLMRVVLRNLLLFVIQLFIYLSVLKIMLCFKPFTNDR